MPPLMNLPAYSYPTNALLNFAPINDAIDSNRKYGLQQRSMAMDEGRYGMQKTEFERAQAERERSAQAWNALQADPKFGQGLPQGMQPVVRALGPEQGTNALMGYYGKQPDREHQAAVLAETRRYHDIQANRQNQEQYGKTGAIVQDKDGTFYSVQFGANGQKRVEPLQYGGNGLTPSKGTTVVGDTIRDSGTGRVIDNVAPNIAGGEQAKVEGRERGERAMGAPKAMAALESAEAKATLVSQKIAQALPMVTNWTAGAGSVLANVPGTPARNLAEIKDTIVANLGFEELQDMRTNSPTGGALGAIAVQELAMLQKTKTSLEQAQSPPQLISALKELQTFMAGSSERRRRAFQATYGQAQPSTQGGAPVRVNSPQEAARLPPGTRFITHDGRELVKN